MPTSTIDTATARPSAVPPSVLWKIVPILIVLAAIAMRASVSFSAPIPPGIDAAYYPLQARSLLETGHLAYHDLPLIFALDAALARFLMLARGMDIDSATLLASRLIDCVSQPLAAIPIFALGLSWAGDRRRTYGLLAAIATPALLATVSLPMLRMTSDFEKNSLGLLWMAAAALLLHRVLARPSPLHWTLLALGVLLSALTHVAAFGATVVLVAGALVSRLLTRDRPSARRLAIAAAACAMLLGASFLTIYIASPRRAASLIAAPLRLFQGDENQRGRGSVPKYVNGPRQGRDGPPRLDAEGPPGIDRFDGPPDFGPEGFGPPSGPPGLDPPDFDRDHVDVPMPPDDNRPDSSDALNRPRGPGGPGSHNDPLPPTIILLVNIIAVASLWRLWRDRSLVPLEQRCLVLAAAATSLVLACPLWTGDYFMRLALIAPLPASILVGFLLMRRAHRGKPAWPAIVLSVASIATVFVAIALMPPFAGVPREPGQQGNAASRQRSPHQPGPFLGTSAIVISQAQADELRAMRSLIDDPASTVILSRHGLQWWAGFLMHVPVREDRVDQRDLAKYDRVLHLLQSRGMSGPAAGSSASPSPGPSPRRMRGPQGAIPRDATLIYDGVYFRLYETRK